MNFAGKRVLVTGGARRIGAAIVREFAQADAEVIVHCRASRQDAENLVASLPHRERHQILVADFARPGAAAELFRQAGRVDVLINNASLYRRSRLAEGDEADDREHFEVNFWSPLALMRLFAAQTSLAEGAVVNLLDQELGGPSPSGGVYAISRRALADATRAMARELGARNLRFNAVAPGPVLPPVGLESSRMEKTLPTVPLHRPVKVKDLVEAVLFLAGNDSATGEIMYLDGGQHLYIGNGR